MCKCLFVEYTCSCSEPDCPHRNPQHRHYHDHNTPFQVDHFKWRYCPRYLALIGISVPSNDESAFSARDIDKRPTLAKKKTMQSLRTIFAGKLNTEKEVKGNKQDSTSMSADNTSRKMETDEEAAPASSWSSSTTEGSMEDSVEKPASGETRLQLPAKPSEDPRHGGEIPECGSIAYEGWCINRRKCRWCEEYWIGRAALI